MPAVPVPWQEMLLPAVALWIVAGAGIALAVHARRVHESRRVIITLVSLGVASLVASAPIAFVAYRQYVLINTQTFLFRIDLNPNESAPDSVIVPVPGDEGLIGGLHVVSGVANWSLVSTVHGRGLLVNFSGPASLEATFAESAPPDAPFGHNVTPTMSENATDMQVDAWIFHEGASGVNLGLWEGRWRVCGSSCEYVDLSQGWRTYPMAFLVI